MGVGECHDCWLESRWSWGEVDDRVEPRLDLTSPLLSMSVLVLKALDKRVSAALLHVGPSMGPEVVGSRKLASAALNIAAKGPIVGMDLHVALEMLVALEPLVAVLAHKLLLAHGELKLGRHRQDTVVRHHSGGVRGVDDGVEVLDLG